MTPVTIQSTNLFGTYGATAEDNGRVVTLYLVPIGSHGVARAVSVRNRVAAPASDDGARPPLIPREYAREPHRSEQLAPDSARLVWSEDGDGVALFERDELVAYIPPPGEGAEKGGYSAYTIGDYKWGEALSEPARKLATERFLKAESQSHQIEAPQFWSDAHASILRKLESQFGPHTGFWLGESGRIPSLAVAQFSRDGGSTLYISVGMSALAMPGGGETRVEVALITDDAPEWAPKTIAWLARYPWANATAIAHGDIILVPGLEPAWFAPDCSAILITNANNSSPIPLLLGHPITLDQQRFAARHGAEALIAQLYSPSAPVNASITTPI